MDEDEMKSRQAGALVLASIGALLLPHDARTESTDLRLQREVRCDQAGGTLQGYVKKLGKASRVGHRATEPYPHHLTAVGVRTPLSRVQSALGTLNHLTVRRTSAEPAEFDLYESKADRQARELARAAAERQGKIDLRDRWAHARDLTFAPPNVLAQRARAGDTKARALMAPRANALARMAFSLPEATIQRIWTQGSVTVPVAS